MLVVAGGEDLPRLVRPLRRLLPLPRRVRVDEVHRPVARRLAQPDVALAVRPACVGEVDEVHELVREDAADVLGGEDPFGRDPDPGRPPRAVGAVRIDRGERGVARAHAVDVDVDGAVAAVAGLAEVGQRHLAEQAGELRVDLLGDRSDVGGRGRRVGGRVEVGGEPGVDADAVPDVEVVGLEAAPPGEERGERTVVAGGERAGRGEQRAGRGRRGRGAGGGAASLSRAGSPQLPW